MRNLLIVCVVIGFLSCTCCLGPLILFTFVPSQMVVENRVREVESSVNEIDHFEEQRREEMNRVIAGLSPSQIVDELKRDGFRVTAENKRGKIARSWSMTKTDAIGNEFNVVLMGPLDDDQKVSLISIAVIINAANPQHDRVKEWFGARSFILSQELKDVIDNRWHDKFQGEIGGLKILWLGNNEYVRSLDLSPATNP